MKQITSNMIKLLLVGFLLSTCHKDTTRPNKEAAEYFPNKVGNYWEYEVYDSTSVKKYVVSISISSKQKLIDNGDAFLWEYRYPWGNDTNYFRIVGDTVKVYDKFRIETINGLQFPLKIFIIPFQEEQRWNGKLLGIDSSHVTLQSSITTSFGTFTNGFNIYHHYQGPNIDYNENYYFIPKVGMVKIFYSHYDLGPTTKILWQLKKYYLN